MFIRNRDQYLIQENLKQAREYLVKMDIKEDDELDFFDDHLVKKLQGFPNLIYTFTRMIYKDDGILNTYREGLRLIEWVKDNKQIVNQLPKNITQYKFLEELADDIVQLELKRKAGKFTKSLYRSMREEVSKLEGDDLKKYNDLALSFMGLSNEAKSGFTPLKYFEKNNISLSEFLEAIGKHINSQDVNEEKKRVMEYIEENPDKLEVVYNENNVIAI